jgi:hypothetical protein
MSRFRSSVRLSQPVMVFVLSLMCVSLTAAGGGSIRKLTLDPDAPVIELFDGLEHGQFAARMSMQNAHEGRVFLTNRTDKALTVAVPKAVVGIHVLPQFGANGGNNVNPFGNSNGAANNNAANGQAQGVGGVLGALGNANGAGNGFPNVPGGMQNQMPGNNFFSIPAEKTVQLSVRSVCLNHGRPEPTAGMKYQLTKVETFITDPVLQQLLEDYTPRINKSAQQAAAWHLANGLSWKQLANLSQQHMPGVSTPLFTKAQVDAARELVEQARQNVAERATPKATVPTLATARRE